MINSGLVRKKKFLKLWHRQVLQIPEAVNAPRQPEHMLWKFPVEVQHQFKKKTCVLANLSDYSGAFTDSSHIKKKKKSKLFLNGLLTGRWLSLMKYGCRLNSSRLQASGQFPDNQCVCVLSPRPRLNLLSVGYMQQKRLRAPDMSCINTPGCYFYCCDSFLRMELDLSEEMLHEHVYVFNNFLCVAHSHTPTRSLLDLLNAGAGCGRWPGGVSASHDGTLVQFNRKREEVSLDVLLWLSWAHAVRLLRLNEQRHRSQNKKRRRLKLQNGRSLVLMKKTQTSTISCTERETSTVLSG